jgi:hypothetical protein
MEFALMNLYRRPLKKSRRKKGQIGRERPHFWAVNPPNGSWRHSRPKRRQRDSVLAACVIVAALQVEARDGILR